MIKNIRFYLSGPMEAVADHGVNWRRKTLAKLVENGADPHNVLDPTNNPTRSRDLKTEFEFFEKARKEKDIIAIKKMSKTLIREDLRMVDISDCIILGIFSDSIFCDDGCFPRTCGTIHEIVVATEQHKPIYVISDIDIFCFPSWLLGLLPTECYFDNIDKCVKKICEDISLNRDDRWVLLRNNDVQAS